MSVELYEHHRAPKGNRRFQLHFRQMKVEKVLYDSSNNMALIGQYKLPILVKISYNISTVV